MGTSQVCAIPGGRFPPLQYPGLYLRLESLNLLVPPWSTTSKDTAVRQRVIPCRTAVRGRGAPRGSLAQICALSLIQVRQGIVWGTGDAQPPPTAVPSDVGVLGLSIPKEGLGSLHVQESWWQWRSRGALQQQISAALGVYLLSLAHTIPRHSWALQLVTHKLPLSRGWL